MLMLGLIRRVKESHQGDLGIHGSPEAIADLLPSLHPFFYSWMGFRRRHQCSPRYQEQSTLKLADTVFQQQRCVVWGLSMGAPPTRPCERQPGSPQGPPAFLQTTGLSSGRPLQPPLLWSTTAFSQSSLFFPVLSWCCFSPYLQTRTPS